MLGPGNSSTEKLHVFSVVDPIDNGDRSTRRRRIRPLWIWIAAAIAILVVTGAVIGTLIGKNVIKVGSKAALVAGGADASTSSSSGSSPSTGVPFGSPTEAPSSSTPTSGSSSTSQSSTPTAPPCSTSKDIPSSAKNTWMDPTSWLDMTGFNCTFTDETVGDLPIVGLNSTWDDSKAANANVPPLNKPWGSYASRPFRGVSLGGWLSLEPFITPSLFPGNNIYDESILCGKLGPKEAAAKLENHYSTFVTEDDFAAIAAAGLDHVRIQYSYWAVKTFDGDTFVTGVSWRYLLRGIEWARKHGLRVKLDLHGVPGSQNGWNHSGKQGSVNWISGPDGAANAQRTLDIHDQLSKFFAQDRYKNVIAFYGLVNEPALAIPLDQLIAWTEKAYDIVHGNGMTAAIVFSESMRGLSPWQGKLAGYGDSLVIDVHEYTLFDNALLALKHADRVAFACSGWVGQLTSGMNPASGFGPVMVGEFSQADTDCTPALNGVSNGARWDGTFFNMAPACPTKDSQCSCDVGRADPSTFTPEYKTFLQTWAEAQMFAFEKSWGWFYWTWKTETAPLWSYQAGLQGGFLPPLAYQRSWDCSKALPSFGSLPEFY